MLSRFARVVRRSGFSAVLGFSGCAFVWAGGVLSAFARATPTWTLWLVTACLWFVGVCSFVLAIGYTSEVLADARSLR